MLMKSLAALLLSTALYPVGSPGQRPPTVSQRQTDEYARRDLKLERDSLARREKMDAMLPPWAKRRLDVAARAFLKRLLSEGQSADLALVVGEEVGKQFKDVSPQQSNILTLHVLTSVVRMLPPHSVKRTDLRPEERRDGISDLNQQDMLMLQQLMERKNQLETMISNVMKATSQDSQAAIQSLKAS
jgi:uncharacterized protein YdcH (DUF465 family)